MADRSNDELNVTDGEERRGSLSSAGNSVNNSFTPLSFKETKAVLLSKASVYVVLFLAAVAISTTTYFVNEREQEEDFETEFKTIAKEIIDVAEFNAYKAVSVMEELATATTSYIVNSAASIQPPFFMIPHFDLRGKEVRKLTGARHVFHSILVDAFDKETWETYASLHQGWIKDSLQYEGIDVDPGKIPEHIQMPFVSNSDMADEPLIFYNRQNPDGYQIHLPIHQLDPAPMNATVMLQDMAWVEWFRNMAIGTAVSGEALISKIVDADFVLLNTAGALSNRSPRSLLMYPYYASFTNKNPGNSGGLLAAVIPWDAYFSNLMPDGADGVRLIVNDGCGSEFTFDVTEKDVVSIGEGALYDSKYAYLGQTRVLSDFGKFAGSRFGAFASINTNDNVVECVYELSVYPTSRFESKYEDKEPIIYAVAFFIIFVITAMIFLLYEVAVQKRQIKILLAAQKTTAIIASLFPKSVQQRILQEAEEEPAAARAKKTRFGARHGLQQFLSEDEKERDDDGHMFKTKPIADLFPEVTIMFADMVGFIAWSSTRDPSQVFMLLETIFSAFDQTAHKRKVFKVETVGDSYVAVAGLPDPRKDHAVVMALFAQDCMQVMTDLTKQLEETLGPDTGELALRVGLHSGPVTAGVLRGEKARFQLFGDTMNTASRMETTGERFRIQVSQETADLLVEAGKSDWLSQREGKIRAKGKGELTTYWLCTRSDGGNVRSSSNKIEPIEAEAAEEVQDDPGLRLKLSSKMMRLVRWNAEVLCTLLKQIVARREAVRVQPAPKQVIRRLEQEERKMNVIDEVVEVITLPKFNARVVEKQREWSLVELDPDVVEQLHCFIERVALCYHDNPFHNFEHVSHVTLSVVKLMGRIIAPDIEVLAQSSDKTLHDHTYGITSDPMTQFAVVFSALIHDVDHLGVPNAQLVKEEAPVALRYNNKSVAEQNSVDVAWMVLMDPDFEKLRNTIYSTEDEYRRFRQLVVNCVMATDIIDKDLSEARKARWNKAFDTTALRNSGMSVHRKATIVLEYVIQASDVAHTMQHWNVYLKWNKRLFEEMYKAYTEGHADKNPLDYWYEGEIGFFDHYIIPLAKRLKDCGVFGVSCDEYLTYATHNRRQWEEKGRQVVAELTNQVYSK